MQGLHETITLQCGFMQRRRLVAATTSRRVTPPLDSISSSLGNRCFPWLGEGLSMSSPNDPVLYSPLPYRVAPVFVQVVSPPLGWSPLTSFPVIWSPSGDTRGLSVVFEAVDMPCPGSFHFSHSVDYIYEFCPPPNPDVGPSIFVCDAGVEIKPNFPLAWGMSSPEKLLVPKKNH